MRVDGTYIGESRKASDGNQADPKAVADRNAPGPAGGAEVVLSQDRLIAAAMQADEVNTRAVEEARALLKSGELDTPETARRAAQRIVDLGL